MVEERIDSHLEVLNELKTYIKKIIIPIIRSKVIQDLVTDFDPPAPCEEQICSFLRRKLLPQNKSGKYPCGACWQGVGDNYAPPVTAGSIRNVVVLVADSQLSVISLQ